MPFRPDRLKALREAKALSQQDLARLAGVSQSLIVKSERGLSAPRSEKLDRLAVALDTTIDYLYGRGFEHLEPAAATAQMAFDVFARDPAFTDEQRERCRRALGHPDAPKTARAWRSLAEMLDLGIGPAPGIGLTLVRTRRSKSKA